MITRQRNFRWPDTSLQRRRISFRRFDSLIARQANGPISQSNLDDQRGYKVLEGVRGQGPRDIGALVQAMVGLSDIFAAHRNHLTDMEINPIMVRAQGGGVAAVDVRLIRK